MTATEPSAPVAQRRYRALARVYWRAPRQPIYSLLFLLPLVVFYEFGALLLRSARPGLGLVASDLLEGLLAWLGPSGVWVPGLALLGTLLALQLAAQASWRVRAWVPILMVLECAVLTLPLLALSGLAQLAIVPAPESSPALLAVVASLGAGAYEELLFRMYLVGGGVLVLHRGLHLPERIVTPLVVVGAALLFSWCHFAPVGGDPFSWPRLLMRWAAGVYLALVFLGRGLGIAAGTHVAYNLFLLF